MSEQKRGISYKKIIKTLIANQHKPIEYTLDYLSKFRLVGIEDITNKVTELANQKVIILKKTEKGFEYKIRDKNQSNEKEDAEGESI